MLKSAAVCGIVKITYLGALGAHADLACEIMIDTRFDRSLLMFLGATYNLVIWSGSEIFVIIVCGSVPPLKPLWDRYVLKKPVGRSGAYQYNSQVTGYAMMPPHTKNITSVSSTAGHRFLGTDKFGSDEIAATTDIEIISTKNSV